MVPRRPVVLVSLALAAVILGWSVWALLPGPRLEHRFRVLLGAAGDRNWPKVAALVADDFRGPHGETRSDAIDDARSALGNFLSLQVVASQVDIRRDGRRALVTCRLRLEGRGNVIGEEIRDRVNALQSDFRFAWERKSWKPWDWQLVALSQPELDSFETP